MQEEAHKGPSKAKRARKAEPGLRQGQSSRQKTALTPEQQIYNKLIVIPGVGPANAELFAKAGYTSVEAVLKTFQTTCSLNADHFREHLRVRICQQTTTNPAFLILNWVQYRPSSRDHVAICFSSHLHLSSDYTMLLSWAVTTHKLALHAKLACLLLAIDSP